MLKFFERHSAARWRVALLLLAVPLVLVGAIFIWQDYQARRQAIVTQVGLKSALVNSQLEDFVHMVRGASGVFANNWVSTYGPDSTDPSRLESQNAFLANFVSDRPHFSRAFITGADGMIRSSSDASSVAGRVGGFELYERAIATQSFTVSDMVVPEGEESPFALFVQPLVWSSAATGGFLVLQSDLDVVSGALDMSIGFPATPSLEYPGVQHIAAQELGVGPVQPVDLPSESVAHLTEGGSGAQGDSGILVGVHEPEQVHGRTPLPRPLPDLTATRRLSTKEPRTSRCLAQSSTTRMPEASSSGVGTMPDGPCIGLALGLINGLDGRDPRT